VFFRWWVEEGEITETPMRNMRPPQIPEEPPAVLGENDLRALLKACEGKASMTSATPRSFAC
jgi:integrase/recombinase XerC